MLYGVSSKAVCIAQKLSSGGGFLFVELKYVYNRLIADLN